MLFYLIKVKSGTPESLLFFEYSFFEVSEGRGGVIVGHW